MKKAVEHVVDLDNLKALSAAQRAELKALSAMPDDQIDLSDIPALTDEFWRNAVRNPYYKPIKQATTVRVDADVLLWLKGQGKGYQTKINTILRDAMMRDMHLKR
jgi:uncharacterized protein (DUF4415 family)